jgi:predicted metal-dependent phosphoesterase TrpH
MPGKYFSKLTESAAIITRKQYGNASSYKQITGIESMKRNNTKWQKFTVNSTESGDVISNFPLTWQQIDHPEIPTYVAKGWRTMDFHVHTWHSADVLPIEANNPKTIYKKAVDLGLDFISFTDHDTMAAYDQFGWTRDKLIPAVEMKILDRHQVGHTIHINVYSLNKKQFGELKKISQKKQDIHCFIEYLNDQALPFTYNHPFWHETGEILNVQSVLDIAPLFPIIEFNMGRVLPLNLSAMELARLNQKGLAAGSDTHTGDIGRIVTLSQGHDFKSFFQQIAAGKSLITPVNMTVDRFTQEIGSHIQNTFNKKYWLFHKKNYSLNLGIKPLEKLIDFIVHSEPDKMKTVKNVFKQFFSFVNHTKIPAMLYIRSQMALARRIRSFI